MSLKLTEKHLKYREITKISSSLFQMQYDSKFEHEDRRLILDLFLQFSETIHKIVV